MRTCVLLCCALFVACATYHPGPIVGGLAAGIAALDQMLASGAIDPNQYVALKGSLDAIGGVQTAVDGLKASTWGTPEILGTAGTAAVAAATAMRHSAIAKVMQLRGPTEAQRKARSAS